MGLDSHGHMGCLGWWAQGQSNWGTLPKNLIIVQVIIGAFWLTGSYEYMDDLMQLDACRPEVSNHLPPAMNEVVTPLSWQAWDSELAGHPDQRFREYVVNGLRYGFRVGFDYTHTSCRKSDGNLASVRNQPQIVRDYLAEECAQGRVMGPFDPGSLPQVHTNRFGVIPKSTPGKWRLIVDLSSPEGGSVNDGIAQDFCSLKYIGVEEAAHEILA